MGFSKEECDYLLKLARKTIKRALDTGTRMDINPTDVPTEKLIKDGACFVTLYRKPGKQLRGCIGSLEARRPLVFDVVENSLNAAFNDPRFRQLEPYEFKDITIEISILTPKKELHVKSSEDLLNKLVPKKHGLVIEKGWNRATFLPIVWDELTDKQEFLAELCVKAGLRPDEWKDTKHMKFYTYTTVLCEEE